MKRTIVRIHIFTFISIVLLFLTSSAISQSFPRTSGAASEPQVKFSNGKLTVNANNTRIDELIGKICDEAGVELIFVGQLKNSVTRSYVNKPVADVIRDILKGKSYYMSLNANGVKELRVIGDTSSGPGSHVGALAGRTSMRRMTGQGAIGTPGGVKTIQKSKKNQPSKRKPAKANLEDIKKDLESRDDFDREAAVYALADVKGDDAKEAEELIIKSLKEDKSSDVRIAAATVLGEGEVESAVPDLIDALGNDKNEEVREASAEALGNVGDPRSINALVKALGDDDEWTQDAAEDALIWIADNHNDAVVRALKKNLNHPRKSVRTRIKDILEELTDEEFDDED